MILAIGNFIVQEMTVKGGRRRPATGHPENVMINYVRFLDTRSILLKVDPSWHEEPDEEERPRNFHQQRKERILTEIAGLLDQSEKVGNASKLATSLINNEKRFSCAIGNGIAIPHVRCMQTRTLIMAFARCEEGVPFDALDNQNVQIFIGMIAPHYDDRLYLKIYRSIATGFLETDVKEKLLAAQEPSEIIYLFNLYFR